MFSWKSIVIIVVVLLLGFGIFNLKKENSTLQSDLKTLNQTVTGLQAENQSLTANISYLSKPENLLKELKSQFNYKEAGEKLIILVPSAIATSTTSTNR